MTTTSWGHKSITTSMWTSEYWFLKLHLTAFVCLQLKWFTLRPCWPAGHTHNIFHLHCLSYDSQSSAVIHVSVLNVTLLHIYFNMCCSIIFLLQYDTCLLWYLLCCLWTTYVTSMSHPECSCFLNVSISIAGVYALRDGLDQHVPLNSIHVTLWDTTAALGQHVSL